MTKNFRTVLSVVSVFGLLGSVAVSTPSLAADALAVSTNGATVPLAGSMLVAVTAPVLALDTDILADSAAPAADDDAADDDTDSAPAIAPRTLAALVEAQETADTVDAEQECLATSVYFESKGEPLAGQLAVAETVMNRADSGRFAESICGVVRQPGQFSFVRGGRLPRADRDSRAWRQAVAIARIAQGELWNDVAPAALYFHAASVRPNFGGKRIARLGNHIFYR